MNKRIEELYKIIKDAKEELAAIRKECKHEEVEECNYAYERPPNYGIAEVCSECKEHIRDTGKPMLLPEYKIEPIKYETNKTDNRR